MRFTAFYGFEYVSCGETMYLIYFVSIYFQIGATGGNGGTNFYSFHRYRHIFNTSSVPIPKICFIQAENQRLFELGQERNLQIGWLLFGKMRSSYAVHPQYKDRHSDVYAVVTGGGLHPFAYAGKN